MDERRAYERVPIRKHANMYDCSVEMEGAHYLAKLLDVSQGGAKIQLQGYAGYDYYGVTGTVKEDCHDQSCILGRQYTVAWSKGDIMGISFTEPLYQEAEALYAYYGNA